MKQRTYIALLTAVLGTALITLMGCKTYKSFEFQVNNATQSKHPIRVFLFAEDFGIVQPSQVATFTTPEFDVSATATSPNVEITVTARDEVTGVLSPPKQRRFTLNKVDLFEFTDADFRR